MFAAFLAFAASEEETSKTPFYVAGGVLVAWAILVSAIGIKQHREWPATKGLRNAIAGLTALLVAATAAAAVLTG